MRRVAKIVATFFGLGYFPVARGTLASLAAAVLYKLLLGDLPWPVYAGLVLALFLISVPAATSAARALGQKDPRAVVVDEVCGQLALYTCVPATLINVLAGFVLFRIFDIFKPFPIRRVERLPGGWGIMVDDLAAAAYGAAVLHLFLFLRGASLT
jgi:phosphatidylglycerophosphatase A